MTVLVGGSMHKVLGQETRERGQIAHSHINFSERSVLIADDTVLAKPRSKKIDFVNYQYSGNAHDVIAGISLINLLWHGLDNKESMLVDYLKFMIKARMVKQKIHIFVIG
jgi:predicted house-cleaning NTP pyrophosphatase (Maf/HAM1 superfamily)